MLLLFVQMFYFQTDSVFGSTLRVPTVPGRFTSCVDTDVYWLKSFIYTHFVEPLGTSGSSINLRSSFANKV